MSWRSSYLFCPSCKSVYFANQITPIAEDGKFAYWCPSAFCSAHIELVTIDELMILPVVTLNKKGYITEYCCSGHSLRNACDARGYILFTKGIHLESAPKGWAIEDGHLGRECIRSKLSDLARSIHNLNKWATELEPLRK